MIDELKASKELCSLQLSKSLIPYSCFTLLELERAAGLIKTAEKDESFKHIDEVCIRSVGRSEKLLIEKSRAKLPKDSQCLSAYREKSEKLKYGSAFRAPEDVFELRHPF
jgi:hypothetical protein